MKLQARPLIDLVRAPVNFVPETQGVSSVLREMRSRRLHMAVVIDEFGGVSGIVTLEDILEVIVGEIRDEYDTEEAPIQDLGDGRFSSMLPFPSTTCPPTSAPRFPKMATTSRSEVCSSTARAKFRPSAPRLKPSISSSSFGRPTKNASSRSKSCGPAVFPRSRRPCSATSTRPSPVAHRERRGRSQSRSAARLRAAPCRAQRGRMPGGRPAPSARRPAPGRSPNGAGTTATPKS